MTIIKATVLLENRYWVAIFERTDQEGFALARHIFGSEPSDAEVYDFVLNHWENLKFGKPKEFTLKIRRMNPKRLQREVRCEIERIKETTRPSSYAQDYMREELERSKLKKKQKSSREKEARREKQFDLKQAKKKQKKKGH